MRPFWLKISIFALFLFCAHSLNIQAAAEVRGVERQVFQTAAQKAPGPPALILPENVTPQSADQGMPPSLPGQKDLDPPGISPVDTDQEPPVSPLSPERTGNVSAAPVGEGTRKPDLEQGLPGIPVKTTGPKSMRNLPKIKQFKGPLPGRGDDLGSGFWAGHQEEQNPLPARPEQRGLEVYESTDNIGLGGTWRKGRSKAEATVNQGAEPGPQRDRAVPEQDMDGQDQHQTESLPSRKAGKADTE